MTTTTTETTNYVTRGAIVDTVQLMNRFDDAHDAHEVGAIYAASRRIRIVTAPDGVLTAFIDDDVAYSTYENGRGLRGYAATGNWFVPETGPGFYLSEWRNVWSGLDQVTFTHRTLRGWIVASMRDIAL